MRYRLRTLVIAVTAVAALLGAILGIKRFGDWVVIEVERDYWRNTSGAGDSNPNAYPGDLFTAKELEELRAKDATK